MRIVVVLVGVLACSSPHSNAPADALGGTAPDAMPDAMPDAARDAAADAPRDAPVDAPPAMRVVTLHASGNPVYVAYRDGSAAWATPARVDSDTYVIEVSGPYLALAVCTDPIGGSVDAEEYGATPDDGADLAIGCTVFEPAGPPTISFGGSTTEPGIVANGRGSASSMTMPWSFDLSATEGPHEIAVVGTSHTAIVRGIFIGEVNGVGTVDPSVGGAPSIVANEVLTNATMADTIETRVQLFTQHEAMTIFNMESSSAPIVPPSLLLPGETEAVTVSAFDTLYTRSVETFDPTTTMFELPPRISGISFDRFAPTVSASWTSPLPMTGEISMALQNPGDVFGIAAVAVSPAWLAATGATSLSFDASAAGWQPAWSTELFDATFTGVFSITQTSPDGVITTSQWQPVFR